MAVPFQIPFDIVPTLVKLEPVTVDFNVFPDNVPASADRVISPLPSNDTPLILLAVASLVAVTALPVVVVADVAVAALPVILPTIGLVTVKLVKVPTLVKLEPVTVDFNELCGAHRNKISSCCRIHFNL